MKTHGDCGWEEFPTYLPLLIPYVLDILEKRNIVITFFVVGKDASMEENKDALKCLSDSGHEIGNHSFNHEPWFHRYTQERVIREISTTGEEIEKITGMRPVGFRGPGFSYSRETLLTLKQLGYKYDASVFPTFLGPIARFYYLMSANMGKEDKELRDALFGSWKEGLNPLNPFLWDLSPDKLIEIPVTTMPIFRIPIHLSYAIYLSRFSLKLAQMYIKMSLRLCLQLGVQLSFLLHPLDFLGKEDAPELGFFPGMDLSRDYKYKVIETMFDYLVKHFDIVTMRQHASCVERGNNKIILAK